MEAPPTQARSRSGGRFGVQGAEVALDYSYWAVAQLAERRRPPRASEPWTRTTGRPRDRDLLEAN